MVFILQAGMSFLKLPQYKFCNSLIISHCDPLYFRLPAIAELIPYAIPYSCTTMKAMDDADPICTWFCIIQLLFYFFNCIFHIFTMDINFNNSIRHNCGSSFYIGWLYCFCFVKNFCLYPFFNIYAVYNGHWYLGLPLLLFPYSTASFGHLQIQAMQWVQ